MRLSLLLFIAAMPFFGHSQKIKYKDIHTLYAAGDSTAADKLLKRFLADKGGTDEVHANFAAGKYYMRLTCELDFLHESDRSGLLSDSAIFYLTKAKEGVDEKELRKNDDYYTEFEKIDARTGKKDIKVFDVHFRINELQEQVNARKLAVSSLAREGKDLQDRYNKIQSAFDAYIGHFKSKDELLLRANLSSLSSLEKINQDYSSFISDYTAWGQRVENLSCSSIDLEPNVDRIIEFSDRMPGTDIMASVPQIFDYGQWSSEIRKTVVSEILPLKNSIIKYDERLQEIISGLKPGVSISSEELIKADEIFNKSNLLKYDKEPLPLSLFNLKKQIIQYHNLLVQHGLFQASENWQRRAEHLEQELNSLKKIDSLVVRIVKMDIDYHSRNYSDYLSARYGGVQGLDTFLKSLVSEFESQFGFKKAELAETLQRNSYVLAGERRIPVDKAGENSIFTPKGIFGDHITGLVLTDKGKRLYIAQLSPARVSDYFLEINPDSLVLEPFPIIQAIQSPDSSYTLFMITEKEQQTRIIKGQAEEITDVSVPDSLSVNHSLILSEKGKGVIFVMLESKMLTHKWSFNGFFPGEITKIQLLPQQIIKIESRKEDNTLLQYIIDSEGIRSDSPPDLIRN